MSLSPTPQLHLNKIFEALVLLRSIGVTINSSALVGATFPRIKNVDKIITMVEKVSLFIIFPFHRKLVLLLADITSTSAFNCGGHHHYFFYKSSGKHGTSIGISGQLEKADDDIVSEYPFPENPFQGLESSPSPPPHPPTDNEQPSTVD
jgi:hypothetical protein